MKQIMSKPKEKGRTAALLAAAEELLAHAEWMGCPVGYSKEDLAPMFKRAETAIARVKGKMIWDQKPRKISDYPCKEISL